ncbi:MAG TPA: hypothetical protein QF753_15040 [Victivallales bacterium]|nr:hypothetical protein [Victivallales bacterium]
MSKLNEYITIEEASAITKKSVSTIRRFVLAHKEAGNDIIKVDLNDKNRPLYRINRQFILSYFDLTKKSFKKNTSDLNSSESVGKKMLANYYYYKNSYKLLKKLFIIFVIFSLIIDLVLIFSFVYYKNDLMNAHTGDVDYLLKQLKDVKIELKDAQKVYQNNLLEYKKMWQKNTNNDMYVSKKVTEDSVKLNEIYEELKKKKEK